MIFKIPLYLFVAFASYQSIRSAAWTEMVAVPYMAATYQTVRCNKYWSVHYDQELAKQIGAIEQMARKGTIPAVCSFDEAACETSKKMWAEYEVSRKQFQKHRWAPFFKAFWKRTVLGNK